MLHAPKRLLMGIVAAGWIFAANIGPANAVAFNIDWTGSGGYTLEGMFSYDDSLIGTGPIDESSLDTFMIEGFFNGGSVGTWDFFADGISAGAGFNFNFDTTSEMFLVGGVTGSASGQAWNIEPVVGVCTADFGFGSGSTGQGLCVGGGLAGLISPSQSTLTASRKQVPEPGTLALFLIGILGLAIATRRKTAAA
ncbi:MAG: PEP-CTERM sorting domain-containing protein [Pseudomonadota bacterium]